LGRRFDGTGSVLLQCGDSGVIDEQIHLPSPLPFISMCHPLLWTH
jgi:hypothetical protein